MKLLKNIFKITIIFIILAILCYIMVSTFITIIEDNYINLDNSLPLLILFLAIVYAYDSDKLLKL